MLVEARQQLAGIDLDETYGIVLAADGWHPGVVGIVASRLVEETGRPTVLIALMEARDAARAFDLGVRSA